MMIKTEFVDNIIHLANKFEGKVFGGYVRDIILGNKINPIIGEDFKDIDIWFISQEHADYFIDSLKTNYIVKSTGFDVEPGTVDYTFARKQYAIQLTESYDLWIDVVVSEIFPVDDFDVNCFVYYNGAISCQNKNLDEEQVLTNINNKTMVMLPKYKNKFIDSDHGEVHRCRIRNRYLDKGWIIKYDDGMDYENHVLPNSDSKIIKTINPFEKTILDETDEKITYYQRGDDRQIYSMFK